MHDWTRVDASIFHAFHHEWTSEIKRTLNRGLPSPDLYAMIEPPAERLRLAAQTPPHDSGGVTSGGIAVRHVSGDRIVAMIEIVSPGNKSSRSSFKAFVDKACELLEHRVHLLLIDPFPSGPRDPNGIHGAIWELVDDEPFVVPPARPLTLVAYQCSLITEAFIETMAVGESVPDMPLFLEPDAHILVPLEATYQSAWDTVPARWQRVIAAP